MGSVSAFFWAAVSTLWTWIVLGFAAFAGYQVSQQRELETIPGFDALPAFLRLPLQHQTESSIVFTLAGVVSGFMVFFFISYVWQAWLDFVRLGLVRLSLKKSGTDPTQWRWFFYPLMTALWQEYTETLHKQSPHPLNSANTPLSYRSTLPAETIFSVQSLVDVPMRVEFFRHLPGILTGAGIVSTFAGILLGLSEFNPAVEAQQITFQLKNLFTGITTAFVASFFAIFAAILVTILEKFLLHWRYAQVTSLQHRIDDIFQAGIEPEYLASLLYNGQAGFQQVQQEIARLAVSMMAQVQHPIETVVSYSPPAVVAPPPPTPLLDFSHRTLQELLGDPLLEISQLLRQATEAQGRRREEGRSFEIQLISVGERLDVALGEFAYSIAGLKEKMDDSENTIHALMRQQRDLLVTINTNMEDVSQQLRAINEESTETEETQIEATQIEDRDEDHSAREAMASLLQRTLESQTLALQSWQEQTNALHGLQQTLDKAVEHAPNKEVLGQSLQDIRASLDALSGKFPEEQTSAMAVWQEQTNALHGLQQTLDKAVEHAPNKEVLGQSLQDIRASLDALSGKFPEEQTSAMAVWQEQTQVLQGLQQTIDKAVEQFPNQLMAWTEGQNQRLHKNLLDGFAHQLQETSNHITQQFSQLQKKMLDDRGSMEETLQGLLASLSQVTEMNATQSILLQEQANGKQTLGEITQAIKDVEQSLSVKEVDDQKMVFTVSDLMTRIDHELRQLQVQFHENSHEWAQRLANQSKEMDAKNEIDSGLRIQGLADQLAEELKMTLQKLTEEQQIQIQEQNTLLVKRLQNESQQLTGQVKSSVKEGLLDSTQKLHEQMLEMEKLQSRSSQEVAEKISDVLFTRLEHSFGSLTKGLSELRERFSNERNSIVSTMENWMLDTSRSDQEKTQKIDQKISEVIHHINTQHNDLVSVIDVLNQNLSSDLDGMRDGLLVKNDESTQHVTQTVTDLGRVLEGVVNSVGQEQTAFIEMLGERLELLRRRMKVK